MDYIRKVVSLAIVALLVLSCPYVLNNLPGKFHSNATSLVFFGTSQTLVLNGNSVELSLNLTNVDPTPINATAQAAVEDAINGQIFEIVNSSVVALMPSTPTIVNMTIKALTLCTNYSLLVEVHSVSGAILTPIEQIFTFPCDAYGQALTLAAPFKEFSTSPPGINATFTNNLDVSVKATVFAVFRNSIGQTLCVCTSSIDFGPGESNSVYIIAQGLPNGSYNATVFVFDANGTPISAKYSVQVSGSVTP